MWIIKNTLIYINSHIYTTLCSAMMEYVFSRMSGLYFDTCMWLLWMCLFGIYIMCSSVRDVTQSHSSCYISSTVFTLPPWADPSDHRPKGPSIAFLQHSSQFLRIYYSFAGSKTAIVCSAQFCCTMTVDNALENRASRRAKNNWFRYLHGGLPQDINDWTTTTI